MAIRFVPRGTDVLMTVDRFGPRPTTTVWTTNLESASQALDGFIEQVMGLLSRPGTTTAQVRQLVGPGG
jgi:hypothetical protein